MSTGKADWLGPQPDDPKPIIYLSGVIEDKDMPWERFVQTTGYHYYCLSYAYCDEAQRRFSRLNRRALDIYLKFGHRVFLDSGAHTFHELAYNKMGTRRSSTTERLEQRKSIDKQIQAYAKAYAKWIQKFPVGTFDFYVNLDYVIHAPTIYRMQHRLEDKLNIRPIPVYHGDSELSWLQRYYDEGHKLVGIGLNPTARTGTQRRLYYDKVFEFAIAKGLSLHGFGCTGADAFAYPWYSVDSATWVKEASFGRIVELVADSQGNPKYVNWEISQRRIPSHIHLEEVQLKASTLGLKFEDLHVRQVYRCLYNVLAFKRASEQFQARQARIPWKNKLC